MSDLPVSASLVIPAAELSWAAVRASGPGGQNVNKVATKVELRFDLPASPVLSMSVKARLRTLAASRLDAEGKVVVVDQSSRTQSQNLENAREKLAELIRKAPVVPKKRKATRPSLGAKKRRLESKHKQGEKKRARSARHDD